MIPQDVIAELPLINLTSWNPWGTDVPQDALTFTCDIRQGQSGESQNPLMEVSNVLVQGQARMGHVRQSIDEIIGMTIDFYLGGEQVIHSEPIDDECDTCRAALSEYFAALAQAYEETVPRPEAPATPVFPSYLGMFAQAQEPVPFPDILVRQPARLSWKGAFIKDGSDGWRFAPKAVGMSYDLNDAFLLVENAVREYGAQVTAPVDVAKSKVEEVVSDAVRDCGVKAQNVACGWREGYGSSADGVICKWSSSMLATEQAPEDKEEEGS